MRRIFLSLVVGIIILFNTLVVNAAGTNTKAEFDTTMLESGVIGIRCSSDVDKIKVLIEKNGKRYSYNINNDGTEESFSLQMGNGEYKVSVMENVGGDKYKYIATENVSLKLSDVNLIYLSSIQNVSWDDSSAAVKKAQELTQNIKNDADKLKAIYNYVVENFKYDYEKLSKLQSTYLPDIDSTMSSRTGICYDFASTFAAMLRSAGIPTKLVKGYAEKVNGYHAWNEVYMEDTNNWIVIDTTYDSQMKEANSKYNMEKQAGQYTKVYEY